MLASWLSWVDTCMQRCGMRQPARKAVQHYLVMLCEQLSAMLPLSLLQVLVLAVFFHKSAEDPGIAAAGLLSAVLGLVLFLDGLRLSIMPLAMQVGQHLPQKMPLCVVVLVTFALGVLVTYAEPAIAAIRPLAALVNPHAAPYLYYVLNQQQEITVLSIGLGVGLAAVLGMLKFLYDLPLKALIAGALLPTVAAACWMQWGNPHLQPILGVAWDCGAVTTGPVTVPILIALGVSVMQAQRQRQAALAALEEAAVNRSEGNTLEGFGIVTLASLLPILAVELMAIVISLTHPYESVLQEVSAAAALAANTTEPFINRSPVREVVFAVRAIFPLCAALLLLVLAVLRVPLPTNSDHQHTAAQGTEAGESGSSSRDSFSSGEQSPFRDERPAVLEPNSTEQDVPHCQVSIHQHPHLTPGRTRSTVVDATSTVIIPGDPSSSALLADAAAGPAASKPPQTAAKPSDVTVMAYCDAQLQDVEQQELDSCAAAVSTSCLTEPGLHQPLCSIHDCSGNGLHRRRCSWGSSRCCEWLSQHSNLLWGMLMCQVGMILFNLGLTYGFTALGDLTGTWLPASFLKLPYAPGSPYYSVAGGVVLTMATVGLLGVLATNAEPALNVLGQTVESLSGGQFSQRLLVAAVSVGVGVGMAAGACKILFSLPLIYFILAKYTAASVLTLLTEEAYTAVAWDSAGVTTGPVTVPFVLSIGLAFGRAVGAPEGFGMLTVMSVAPIISVLVTSLLRKPVQQATSQLIRGSTNLAKQSFGRLPSLPKWSAAPGSSTPSMSRSDSASQFMADTPRDRPPGPTTALNS